MADVGALSALLAVVVVVILGFVPDPLRLVAVVAVSVVATRVALGAAPSPTGAHPVGPARSGVLLMNPRAGGGKVTRFALVKERLARRLRHHRPGRRVPRCQAGHRRPAVPRPPGPRWPPDRPPLRWRGRSRRTAGRHRPRLQRRLPPRSHRRIRPQGTAGRRHSRGRHRDRGAGSDVPVLLAAEAAGRVASFPGYREWTAAEFDLDSGEELVDVGVDGEALRLAPPLQVRSLPGALRVRTPVDRPGGEAGTAVRGHTSAVPALLGVRTGHPDR